MGNIKKLSKSVSDKIAAGEVVERPLSVVKELVENAIDAEASAINISLSGGGIKQISVSDNGIGIRAEDVELAFEKHATSKIETERDLHYISTQGFRGEALCSIAAVAVVEMKTKHREEDMGMQLRIAGGRLDAAVPAGLPDGTSVTVSNLFFNVPARLKFLKTEAKEAAYVSDLVSRFILAFPEISFHYTSQQKNIYHSPGNGNLKDAIYCVYGGVMMENIDYVSHEAAGIRVEGYVSRAGAVMANRQKGSVFVNRRFVRSTALVDMVKGGYGQTLVKGEYPFFALNISMPAGAVDVNVHPNKLQVRFADTAAVEHVIREAVSQACQDVHGSVAIDLPQTPPKKDVSVEMHTSEDVLQTALFSGFARAALKETEVLSPADDHSFAYMRTEEALEKPLAQIEEPLRLPVSYRLIGSFADTYVLIEKGDKLLIIDQHAAHERVLYERFAAEICNDAQPLLMPLVLTVSHAQKNLIDEKLNILVELGFGIEPFGTMEYKLDSTPAIAHGADPEEVFYDALSEISQKEDDIVLLREKVIRRACRSAVKAGDRLSQAELLNVVQSFLDTGVVPTCPHGRPVISVITKAQLEKSFKRVL